jgi:predicted DNA-binding transcriptional regulator AlpA
LIFIAFNIFNPRNSQIFLTGTGLQTDGAPPMRAFLQGFCIMTDRMKVLLSANDVASMTGLSRRTVFRMKCTGMICPPIKVGAGSQKWRKSDIDRWIELDCCSASEFLARKEAVA